MVFIPAWSVTTLPAKHEAVEGVFDSFAARGVTKERPYYVDEWAEDLVEGAKIEARADMPFGFIKKAIKKVGSAIQGTAKFVGKTVGTVAKVAAGGVLGERLTVPGGPEIVIARSPASTGSEQTSFLGGAGNNKTLVYGGLALAAVLLLSRR